MGETRKRQRGASNSTTVLLTVLACLLGLWVIVIVKPEQTSPARRVAVASPSASASLVEAEPPLTDEESVSAEPGYEPVPVSTPMAPLASPSPSARRSTAAGSPKPAPSAAPSSGAAGSRPTDASNPRTDPTSAPRQATSTGSTHAPATSASNPRGTSAGNPRGTSASNPRGTSASNPRGTSASNPPGTSASNPRGTSASNPRGTFAGTARASTGNARGPSAGNATAQRADTPPAIAVRPNDGTDATIEEPPDFELLALRDPIERQGTRAVVLGVARVEQREGVCTVWAFACNLTGRAYDVPLSGMQMMGANGTPLSPTRYRPAGRFVTLGGSNMLYMWPSYRLSSGAAEGGQRLEFRLRVEGYGVVHVPIEEQMTNLGAYDKLPPYLRERLGSELKANRSFKWWGE